jgi:hypothetical protein
MVSVLDICNAFRSYLKPRFGFSQAGRAYYFTDPLLLSSLAKSKPDGDSMDTSRKDMDRSRTKVVYQR